MWHLTWGANWCVNWCQAGDCFSKCGFSHVLLLLIYMLMSEFGKSITNLVNNLWFTVNPNFILLVHLTWSGTPLAATAATVVNVFYHKY